jgi:hypothetical protein
LCYNTALPNNLVIAHSNFKAPKRGKENEMKDSERKPFASAMAFYHQDGLTAAWQQAMRFAGKNGRLATMPDIISARIETKPEEVPWNSYFTTLTAEYYGLSKAGNRILIVAHGIGPMSTLEGVQKTYSWEYKDRERARRGGRITMQEFLDLEAGKFGKVEIIDFKAYCKRYKYPFIGTLRVSQAITDPVLKARLGPQTEQYVQTHAAMARKWHIEQASHDPNDRYNLIRNEQSLRYRRQQHIQDGAAGSDPFIISVSDAANCPYPSAPLFIDQRPFANEYAVAHLISTSALHILHHEGNESLTLDVSCHEWWNGVRVVGIKEGSSTRSGINAGPDAYKLLREHWNRLFIPAQDREIGFCALVQIGDQWFTQYPKAGEQMDTWEPEYLVTSTKKVGKPILFRTTSNGSSIFFRFSVNEVKAIAPPNSNAYSFIEEPTLDSNNQHVCMTQFYRIEADTSRRLVRADRLARDYDTMIELLTKESDQVNFL